MCIDRASAHAFRKGVTGLIRRLPRALLTPPPHLHATSNVTFLAGCYIETHNLAARGTTGPARARVWLLRAIKDVAAWPPCRVSPPHPHAGRSHDRLARSLRLPRRHLLDQVMRGRYDIPPRAVVCLVSTLEGHAGRHLPLCLQVIGALTARIQHQIDPGEDVGTRRHLHPRIS